MLKYVLSFVCILTLFGCKPNGMDAAKQKYLCKDKGGLYKYGNIFHKAQCNDGSFVDLSHLAGVILPEGYRPNNKK